MRDIREHQTMSQHKKRLSFRTTTGCKCLLSTKELHTPRLLQVQTVPSRNLIPRRRSSSMDLDASASTPGVADLSLNRRRSQGTRFPGRQSKDLSVFHPRALTRCLPRRRNLDMALPAYARARGVASIAFHRFQSPGARFPGSQSADLRLFRVVARGRCLLRRRDPNMALPAYARTRGVASIIFHRSEIRSSGRRSADPWLFRPGAPQRCLLRPRRSWRCRRFDDLLRRGSRSFWCSFWGGCRSRGGHRSDSLGGKLKTSWVRCPC